MKAPFEEFAVRPSGFGDRNHWVRVWPGLGFWRGLLWVFRGGDSPYLPDVQRKFIEDAIREKMERNITEAT